MVEQEFILQDVNCYMRQFGSESDYCGPIIIWPTFPHQGNEIPHLAECLEAKFKNKEKTFLLFAFEVKDWNRDLSPWKAKGAMGETFAGEGDRTLDWILKYAIPFLQDNILQEKHQASENFNEIISEKESPSVYLVGYSLAGLFSLWSMYQTDAFAGAVCCSGSLWFEGWIDYAREHQVKSHGPIYLSLGGKEEKTSNPLMATVGTCTRTQDKLLKADSSVTSSALVWNSGGHFADSGKRLAQGIEWMLGNNTRFKEKTCG